MNFPLTYMYTPKLIFWEMQCLPCLSQCWSARWHGHIGSQQHWKGWEVKEDHRCWSEEVFQLILSKSVVKRNLCCTSLLATKLYILILTVFSMWSRWRQKEPHDIVIECMKLSLDPVDRMQEKGSLMSSWTFKHSHQDLFADKSISSVLTTSGDSQGPEPSRLKERRMSDSATQTGKSLQSGDSGTGSESLPIIATDRIELIAIPGWSPSDVCGLNTPPSSQMSPSTSYPDLVALDC